MQEEKWTPCLREGARRNWCCALLRCTLGFYPPKLAVRITPAVSRVRNLGGGEVAVLILERGDGSYGVIGKRLLSGTFDVVGDFQDFVCRLQHHSALYFLPFEQIHRQKVGLIEAQFATGILGKKIPVFDGGILLLLAVKSSTEEVIVDREPCHKTAYKSRRLATLGAADKMLNSKSYPTKMGVYLCRRCWQWHASSASKAKNRVELLQGGVMKTAVVLAVLFGLLLTMGVAQEPNPKAINDEVAKQLFNDEVAKQQLWKRLDLHKGESELQVRASLTTNGFGPWLCSPEGGQIVCSAVDKAKHVVSATFFVGDVPLTEATITFLPPLAVAPPPPPPPPPPRKP